MTPTSVHLTTAGQLFIDGEPVVPPPGVDRLTVLAHTLQQQAVEAGRSVEGTVRDDSSGETRHLVVAPDGTTTDQSAPTGSAPTPLPGLPAEYRPLLDAVFACAAAGDLIAATTQADALLAKLSGSLGPQHPGTLVVAQVRADIAWLAGDTTYAFHAWMWTAAAWSAHLPLGSRAVGVATRNAVAAWRHLPSGKAREAAPGLLELLREVAPEPASNPTIHGVKAHLASLTASEIN